MVRFARGKRNKNITRKQKQNGKAASVVTFGWVVFRECLVEPVEVAKPKKASFQMKLSFRARLGSE